MTASVTEKEAVEQLRIILWAYQKYRSTAAELFETEPAEDVAAKWWPWVFGDKCPIPALVQILDLVDLGNPLVIMDYYNQLTILARFVPEVLAVSNIMLSDTPTPGLPDEPDLAILGGWKSEADILKCKFCGRSEFTYSSDGEEEKCIHCGATYHTWIDLWSSPTRTPEK